MRLLSHYTDRTGLEGIARTKTFWGTSFLDVNDTSEFFYAWRELNHAALKQFMVLIPAEKKQPGNDVEKIATAATEKFKDHMKASDGYGCLFVTSFARGTTEDHERRGILTLWDRYTKHEGYCLQFDRGDVERMLQFEFRLANYEWGGLENVKYGVDKNDSEFKELTFQLSQNFLVDTLKTRKDFYVEPQFERMWIDSFLSRKLMHYCATHKDPCYEDEREVRIFAYPAPIAESRIFIGFARKKTIRTTPGGKKYIIFGEYQIPGICPRRIIVGSKANRDLGEVLANYVLGPEVTLADLPVA